MGIILGISSLAVFYYPVFNASISFMCLHFMPRSQWIVTLFSDMLPLFLFGTLLGAVTACMLRNCRLVMAVVPAIIVCCFYVAYGYLGPIKYRPIPPRTWFDVADVFGWCIYLIVASWAAWFILRKRKSADHERPSGSHLNITVGNQ